MTARDEALKLLEGRSGASAAMNYRELAAASGFRPTSMHKALDQLHAARAIHIARFERSRGSPMPYYLLGDLPDATPPAPLTGAEKQKASLARLKTDPKRRRSRLKRRSRRYHERKREEPEEWRNRADAENLRRRIRDGRPARPAFSDPLTAAVFGYAQDEKGRWVKKPA